MSVRLRPAVRCAFDEAQGALRVTLKEPVEDGAGEQLVIYVLRVRLSPFCPTSHAPFFRPALSFGPAPPCVVLEKADR